MPPAAPRTPWVECWLVASPEHGPCYLRTKAAAVQHVKRLLEDDDACRVRIKHTWLSRQAWDALPGTCTYDK